MRRKNVVNSAVNEFPEWTSTHGIPQIGRCSNIEKKRLKWCCVGFWTAVTVLALGLLIWSLVAIFIRYYRYDVRVQTQLRFEQRTFPAVTICDLNPYKRSVTASSYPNVTRLLDTYLYVMRKTACGNDKSCYNENSTLDDYQAMYGLTDITDTATLSTRVKKLLKLEVAQYDYSDSLVNISDILKSCSFNTEKCDRDIDWDTYTDPIMGNCFTFNKGAHRVSNRAGPYYGLRVVLKTNLSEYLSTSDVAGMRAAVHDQNEWPFPDVSGYNVRVGSATSIGVTYQEVSRLGDPYDTCTDARPPGYLYDLDYSIEGCQRTQYQALMVAACGCYDPMYPAPSNSSVSVCSVENNYACWDAQIKNMQPNATNCIQPCHEYDYQGTVSSSVWPKGPIMTLGPCNDNLHNQTCRKAYETSGALLEVYYEKLNYEKMEESAAYSSANLISDFGAQTGLWLGLSVISFIEFLALLVQVCLGCCHPKAGEKMIFDQDKLNKLTN